MTDFLTNIAELPLDLGLSLKQIFDDLLSEDLLTSAVYILVPFLSLIVCIILVDMFKKCFRRVS